MADRIAHGRDHHPQHSVTRRIAPGAQGSALVGSGIIQHSDYTPTVDAPYDALSQGLARSCVERLPNTIEDALDHRSVPASSAGRS